MYNYPRVENKKDIHETVPRSNWVLYPYLTIINLTVLSDVAIIKLTKPYVIKTYPCLAKNVEDTFVGKMATGFYI